MKQKDRFRCAEKYLYEYMKNVACLKVLRDDLQIKRAGSDVKAQNYQSPFGFTGEPSNPVYTHVVSIETLEERIKQLERWTKPIAQMIADLNNQYALSGSKNADLVQILELMYFGSNRPEVVIDKLQIARRTFTRRRHELVHLTVDYLGL